MLTRRTATTVVFALAALTAASNCCCELRAAEIVIESAMFTDPKIEVTPEIFFFDPRLKDLWYQALAQPEADAKSEAAKAIALAHSRGMKELSDAGAHLTKALEEEDLHPVAASAIARALIEINARDSARLLHKLAVAKGGELALLIEPALIKWKFEPAKKTWNERLRAEHPPRRLAIVAMKGLAELNDASAAPRLREIALDPTQATSVRVEAARSLSRLQKSGLIDDARQLAKNKAATHSVDRLLAASMIAHHQDAAAKALLLELAVDPESTVAAAALAGLVEFDPAAVITVHEKALASADANVRHHVVRALIAVPSTDHISLLAKQLGDVDRDVRTHVRNALFTFAAEPQYKDLVIKLATEALAGVKWQALEEASILLGALDHKPAAERIVKLIEHPKYQVYVAAAWSLRKLQVRSTLPAMLDRAKRMTDYLSDTKKLTETNEPGHEINNQICELLQAFGLMKYAESMPLIIKYVPKGGVPEIQTRCAAIWAGGYILEGKPDERAVKALIDRLSDVEGPDPEQQRVRRMSAISLGRMKAEKALPALRTFYEQGREGRVVGYACAWAIRKITGEKLDDPPAPTFEQRGWFLEPIAQ